MGSGLSDAFHLCVPRCFLYDAWPCWTAPKRRRSSQLEYYDAVSVLSDDHSGTGRRGRISTIASILFEDCESLDGDAMPVSDDELAAMQSRFPTVGLDELLRYYNGAQRKLNLAISRLVWREEWRRKHPAGVIEAALSKVQSVNFITSCGLAYDGTPVIFVQCAAYNPQIASPEEYALACVGVMDKVCSLEYNGKVTVLHDVRPGKGWPNKTIFDLLPFVRALAPMFAGLFPGRLARDIVYPVAWWARKLIDLAKSLLDPSVAKKLVIIDGACHVDAPSPVALSSWLSYESLPDFAKSRHITLLA